MSETIPLRDVVRALRAEIISAAKDASAQEVKFELGQIELEFQIVAKKDRGVDGKLGGKVSFHILSFDATLGGNVKVADERTQKVKLVLQPTFVDGTGTKNSKISISRRKQAATGS
jgi:hypothetical protein